MIKCEAGGRGGVFFFFPPFVLILVPGTPLLLVVLLSKNALFACKVFCESWSFCRTDARECHC